MPGLAGRPVGLGHECGFGRGSIHRPWGDKHGAVGGVGLFSREDYRPRFALKKILLLQFWDGYGWQDRKEAGHKFSAGLVKHERAHARTHSASWVGVGVGEELPAQERILGFQEYLTGLFKAWMSLSNCIYHLRIKLWKMLFLYYLSRILPCFSRCFSFLCCLTLYIGLPSSSLQGSVKIRNGLFTLSYKYTSSLHPRITRKTSCPCVNA